MFLFSAYYLQSLSTGKRKKNGQTWELYYYLQMSTEHKNENMF